MRIILIFLLSISLFALFSCEGELPPKSGNSNDLDPELINSLKALASKDGFKPYVKNPVIKTGPEGSWDAGALGSMTILRVDDTFHIYYEAWGVRSEKEWDASEYETLQIGHATSKDGIHWTKDPDNPVLKHGKDGEWDDTGVWDPYVIYEDGLFKMWYGGGGGSKPNYGWAYAESNNGTNFKKHGLIGTGNQSGVEDVHVVYDNDSNLYYLYYWHGHEEGEDLFYVTSPTETDFNFNDAKIINIENDDSFWCKFGHVLKNQEGWHMFYSNYIPPHGRMSVVRYALSENGIHWQAKNKRLLFGLDADVLQVTDDIYLMAYAPENHFDKKDADIRVAVYNGSLTELASKPPYVEIKDAGNIAGKSFTIELGEDGLHTFYFKPDGEVIVSEVGEDAYTFNAFYVQNNKNIHIMGENLDLIGVFDRGSFLLINK